MQHVSTDQATSPVTRSPHRFSLGHFDLLVLNDGDYVVPAPFIAANAPPDELARELAALGQTFDAYRTTINILLVSTGVHRVLVDTGFGTAGQAEFPEAGQLLPALASQGIAPEDIDIVILTHLHGDHVAGALDSTGMPTFPKARYLINRVEYAFWWAEPDLAELPIPDVARQAFRDGAKARLVALGDTLEQVEPDTEIVPGIRLVVAPGHTPGHVAVEVVSAGETLLHIVDAAADPVLHLRHPDWVVASDTWPDQAVRTRRQLLDRAASEELLVLGFHFPFPGLGSVRSAGDGWVWQPSESDHRNVT